MGEGAEIMRFDGEQDESGERAGEVAAESRSREGGEGSGRSSVLARPPSIGISVSSSRSEGVIVGVVGSDGACVVLGLVLVSGRRGGPGRGGS